MSDQSQIPNFESTRVLVYGDLMLDRYWYGQATRISPEAPVPVVHVRNQEVRPGGRCECGAQCGQFGWQGDGVGSGGRRPRGPAIARALCISKASNMNFWRCRVILR